MAMLLRRSEDVQAQLDAFRAVLPPESASARAKDFASKLQLQAWREHEEQLKRELAAAQQAERQAGAPGTAGAPVTAPAQKASSGYRGGSFISKEIEITGRVTFPSELIIDGKVEGEISSDGMLTVGENADIRGEIKTRSVRVLGKVQGKINVAERCELTACGSLLGDVKASRLLVEEGATFVGMSEVSTDKSALPAKPQPVEGAPARDF